MMNKAFEKILERLSNIHRVVKTDEDAEWNRAIYKSTEIVQEVAEEYNGGWIPCSERLPEESGTYIVNAIENSIIHVTFAKWMPRMKKWNLTGCRSYWKVNAWQPLPEPFKERD